MTRVLLTLVAGLLPLGQAMAAETVNVITVDGMITPGIASYIEKAIEQSEAEGATALVIELDTPGGLLNATKDIVGSLLNAEIPIVVFVSPRGAWAASAGTFITLAAHVAAMAPGTSIGAAHPVFTGGGGPTPSPPLPGQPGGEESDSPPAVRDYRNEKAENFTAAFIESIAAERERNVEWAIEAVRNSVAISQSEAVKLNVVDLVADDLDHLLELIDGRVIKMGREQVTLHTKDARVVRVEMAPMDAFFALISDPSIAMLLLMAGLAGIYIEVQSPGLIVPGLVGVVSLVLAGLAFQVIPINWVGALLIIAGLALLVAEIFITSFGVLFAAGITSFAFGAYMLFRVPEISDLSVPFWSVIFPAVVVLSGFMAIVVFGVGRSFGRPQFSGREALVGQLAVSETDIRPQGRIRVHGELWNAESDEPIERGQKVEIVGVHDLIVRVREASGSAGRT
ncbi:MAG: nodulation protein NfeD [Myxococcota bacterium]